MPSGPFSPEAGLPAGTGRGGPHGPAAAAGAALRSRGLTLAVAESCTGGMIGAAVTALPGSSRWFRGGIIAYHNEVKERLLGVPPEVLATEGAVSGTTVRAMAAGVRRLLDSDCAVAVSGIAGPEGGTPDKPVGTVWIAVSRGERIRAFEERFPPPRETIRRCTVERSLRALCELLRD